MTVQNRGVAARQWRGWLLVPVLMVLAVSALILRESGSLYWGPLDSDLTSAFYPWRAFIHRWLARGVFPFWDPHVFGGYPTLETQSMLSLNPLHLVTLWLPPDLGLSMFALLQTLTACTAMGWALWRWGRCSVIAAALGAGLYVFGALFAVRIMAGHLTPVAAMAWWPLAALSVLRIARSVVSWQRVCPHCEAASFAYAHESRWRFMIKTRIFLKRFIIVFFYSFRSRHLRRLIALSAASHAMVCLAGAPQYTVYLFYIDMAIIIAVARSGAWLPVLALVASVWALALVLSAPQWLPAFWYIPYSVRGVSSGSATGWSLGSLYNTWFETMLPFPFGDDMTHGHLHFKNVWETALYPGSIALVFSAAVLLRTLAWTGRRIARRPAVLSSIPPLALAGAVIAMAGLYMMAGGWLPGFSGFREPLKARAVVAFAFAIMSASAFDGIARRPATWRPALAVASLLSAAWLAWAYSYSAPLKFRDLVTSFGMPPFDPQAMPAYQAMLDNPADAAHRFKYSILWAAAGVLLLALTLVRRSRWPRAGLAILFLAGLLDPFFAHCSAWLGRHSWSQAGLPKPVAGYFAPLLAENKGQLPWRVILDPGIINRTHHLEGLYEYYGYDPLMPAFAVGRLLVKGLREVPSEQQPSLRPELMRRVGIRYDACKGLGNTASEDLSASNTGVLIVPQASLFDVSRQVVAGSPGINLFGPDLQGTHYVLPPDSAGNISEMPIVPADFQANIHKTFPPVSDPTSSPLQLMAGESMSLAVTGRPDEFGVRVRLVRPALVVYKGTWLPGWRAYIDGKDNGRALLANNWMCAAIVPAGQHEVIFRYRPVLWGFSLGVAAFGTVLFLALLCSGGKWRNRSF